MTRVLRAEAQLDDSTNRVIGPRARVRFHVGTSEVGARVIAPPVILSEAKDPGPAEMSAARSFASLRMTRARLVLDTPLVLRAGDRFVLRRSSPLETIGGGVVIDPLPPKRAKPWPPDLTPSERLLEMV